MEGLVGINLKAKTDIGIGPRIDTLPRSIISHYLTCECACTDMRYRLEEVK
jgi:hypothetical protein